MTIIRVSEADGQTTLTLEEREHGDVEVDTVVLVEDDQVPVRDPVTPDIQESETIKVRRNGNRIHRPTAG